MRNTHNAADSRLRCPEPRSRAIIVQMVYWETISLLNTDYKLLRKSSTNRLKGVINCLVELDQAGFVPGRLIQTNSSTVRDIIDYTEETTGRSGTLTFPHWEKGLQPTGKVFPRKTPGSFSGYWNPSSTKLKQSAKSTLAAGWYNGRVSRFFDVSQGVCQGCPLSPLLYVFGAEILARPRRKNKISKEYRPARTNKSKFLNSQMIQLWGYNQRRSTKSRKLSSTLRRNQDHIRIAPAFHYSFITPPPPPFVTGCVSE